MSVKYYCRYCSTALGEINDPDVSEMQLGFHFLTPEERRDIITYSQHDVNVKLVCEYCREALEAHPELSLVGNPLQ
jgi:hypothetical protein